MSTKKDLQQVEDIIQMLALRKKQFVSVSRVLMPLLLNELENYPGAKIIFFGLSGGSINVIRKSAAKHFKKIVVVS